MIKKENFSSSVSRLPEGAGLLSRNPVEVDPAVLGFVLETANDAVYIFDDRRQIIYVNAKACKLSGYSRHELLQMNISDLDTVHPASTRSEEHTSELQSQSNLVCRLLLE